MLAVKTQFHLFFSYYLQEWSFWFSPSARAEKKSVTMREMVLSAVSLVDGDAAAAPASPSCPPRPQ